MLLRFSCAYGAESRVFHVVNGVDLEEKSKEQVFSSSKCQKILQPAASQDQSEATVDCYSTAAKVKRVSPEANFGNDAIYLFFFP